ncbi:MAG: UDP-N-acetylmuramoyl-tripeptide--D-alanyl-D-alanine ligase [Candidatus Eremiobacteraeota bacterium]|nr:UDP-N-acetylmuramoyl-tripeptide--D-alanyl-D-alanine ligase [Candidatus Eremiobacteraeota bacterium]MBC5826247.1 UDP-N-acetylmuramoyl-tripeptide--D-alanyl-D-alanine ligase [Candidatus Eremiobacteraeota bacterium]
MTTLKQSDFLRVNGGRAFGNELPLRADFVPNTDSRDLAPGQTFVCLRGPNFDGHDFIGVAIAKRCAAVVVDDLTKLPTDCPVPIIAVDNAKSAYLAGASQARRLATAWVIAITGSNGKTTTKAMAQSLLSRKFKVVATLQNENNELGVSKQCYALAGAEIAVFEFGSRHPGDIAQLVRIASPDVAVLTSVAEAHLEYFAGQEELAREKFSIFAQGARPVCNAADAWTRNLARQAGIDAGALWVRLGDDPACGGVTLEVRGPQDGRVTMSFANARADAPWKLLGVHHLRDAMLAAGAALSSGLSFDDVVAGLPDLRLPGGRFEKHATASGATVIYDAYNANPTSMECALRAFAELPATRRVAVLASMAELGGEARLFHERTGCAAATVGLQALYCGGEHAAALARGAVAGGMDAARVSVYADNSELAAELVRTLGPGDAVLLKGSRAYKMEQILDALLARHALA